MTAFVNPLAPRPRGLPAQAAQIKGWTRACLGLAEDVIVSVNQIACREPGCPDVETVIGVLRAGQAVLTAKINRPIIDVTERDVGLALNGQARNE